MQKQTFMEAALWVAEDLTNTALEERAKGPLVAENIFEIFPQQVDYFRQQKYRHLFGTLEPVLTDQRLPDPLGRPGYGCTYGVYKLSAPQGGEEVHMTVVYDHFERDALYYAGFEDLPAHLMVAIDGALALGVFTRSVLEPGKVKATDYPMALKDFKSMVGKLHRELKAVYSQKSEDREAFFATVLERLALYKQNWPCEGPVRVDASGFYFSVFYLTCSPRKVGRVVAYWDSDGERGFVTTLLGNNLPPPLREPVREAFSRMGEGADDYDDDGDA